MMTNVMISSFQFNNQHFKFADLSLLENIANTPYCIRVLLENVVKDNNNRIKLLDLSSKNILIYPSQIVYNNFSCLSALIDLAQIKDQMKFFKRNPMLVQPACKVDIIMDHLVDNAKSFNDKQINNECPFHMNIKDFPLINSENLTYNQKLEMERNKEKNLFLQWVTSSIKNVRVLPPSAATLHPFTLENICSVVMTTDGFSHTTMVLSDDPHILRLNALGIFALEISTLELESVMLGQPMDYKIPKVIGCQIFGKIHPYITSTDIVLAITKTLKKHKLTEAIVEFFGSGVDELSISERMSISGLSSEYSLIGYFPVDNKTLEYLLKSGYEEASFINQFAKYSFSFKKVDHVQPSYEYVVEVDLSLILPQCSCLNCPKDRLPIDQLQDEFTKYLTNRKRCKSCGNVKELLSKDEPLRDGLINSASITSCTNPTNSLVILAAGLLAKKAVECGLELQQYTHATCQPGPGLAMHYLLRTGCHEYLNKLGFKMIGPNCANCSDLLHSFQNRVEIPKDLLKINLHSSLPYMQSKIESKIADSNKCVAMDMMECMDEMMFIMSPMHVVLFAIAANLDFNLAKPLNGKFLSINISDIWPSRNEIEKLEIESILPTVRAEVIDRLQLADKWKKERDVEELFTWNSSSTYIVQSEYFQNFDINEPRLLDVCDARVLVFLGDNITTEYISPAGCIARTTPAGKFLLTKGLTPREFDSYGARRGNCEIMIRGTLSHTHLRNLILSRP